MSLIESGKALAQGLMQGAMAKAVALAPDSWIPGGEPDPLIRHQHGSIGKPVSRIDGPLKVAGAAPFAGRAPRAVHRRGKDALPLFTRSPHRAMEEGRGTIMIVLGILLN